MVATQEKDIVFAKPPLEGGEAAAGFARLYLCDERSLVGAEGVNVEIVARPAEARRAAQRVALRLNADIGVEVHELALDTVTLATMTGATHTRVFPVRATSTASRSAIFCAM